MKTVAAQASKQCKEELKQAFPNTKFSVKSSNYAGGNSITVSWEDGASPDHVKKIVDKFQYGHFNAMEDYYDPSNSRDDIPQVKYAMTQRRYSDQAKEIAKMHLKNRYGLEDFNTEKTIEGFGVQGWSLLNKELNHCYILDHDGVLLMFLETASPQLDEGDYGVYIEKTGSSHYYLLGDSGFPRGFNTFEDLYTFFHVKEEQALPDFINIDTELVPDPA